MLSCWVLRRAALHRVVSAVGQDLNWNQDAPVTSWKHVEVGPSGEIRVLLGKEGDRSCGFSFESSVQLADMVTVFGDKLGSLDLNNKNLAGKITKQHRRGKFAHRSFMDP